MADDKKQSGAAAGAATKTRKKVKRVVSDGVAHILA